MMGNEDQRRDRRITIGRNNFYHEVACAFAKVCTRYPTSLKAFYFINT